MLSALSFGSYSPSPYALHPKLLHLACRGLRMGNPTLLWPRSFLLLVMRNGQENLCVCVCGVKKAHMKSLTLSRSCLHVCLCVCAYGHVCACVGEYMCAHVCVRE